MAHTSVATYQIIHTLAGVIYHLPEHINELLENYYALFRRRTKITEIALRKQITEVIKQSRCPKEVSLFVRLELSEGGVLRVTEHERSLYRGYSLRCISPRVAPVEFNMPHIHIPSSARDALIDFANAEAKYNRGDLALRSHNGCVDMIGGAAIFASLNNELITSQESHSVEHSVLKKLAHQAEINVTYRPIRVDELPLLDELFFVDHYGITSIKACGSRFYMSITANTLASLMGQFNQP